MHFLRKKIDEINEKRKTEVLGNLKDLGNTILGKELLLKDINFLKRKVWVEFG